MVILSDDILQNNPVDMARPGVRVVVIRKPWPIGRWGTVIAFRECDPCYFSVEIK